MNHSTQDPLCFPPVEGLTMRGHLNVGLTLIPRRELLTPDQ
ncbi:MAG: hypothetical protein PHE55_05605 [Methylococcaceae bacterium]|nr:hypothetical protein [Methylococcaceae bacterium]